MIINLILYLSLVVLIELIIILTLYLKEYFNINIKMKVKFKELEEKQTRKPKAKGTEYVYFILAEEVNRVKIGLTTTSVEERRRKLQTGSPCILKTIAYIQTEDSKKLEKELHEKFFVHRTFSNLEFFNYVPEIKEYINKHATQRF